MIILNFTAPRQEKYTPGFTALFTVGKAQLEYKKEDLPVYLDAVKDLGRFAELELLVDAAAVAPYQKEAAVSRLLSTLDLLGIPRENLTQKSYL